MAMDRKLEQNRVEDEQATGTERHHDLVGEAEQFLLSCGAFILLSRVTSDGLDLFLPLYPIQGPPNE